MGKTYKDSHHYREPSQDVHFFGLKRGGKNEHGITRCGITRKVRFPSMAHAIERGRELPEQMRAYNCEKCGGWHLTSQPARSIRLHD